MLVVQLMAAEVVVMLLAETPEIVSGLETVTLTGTLAAVIPAKSRATAVRTWLPFVNVMVFSETEYGARMTSDPILLPSTLNCTPAIPTLLVAVADTVIVPETVVPAAGAVMDTVGGVEPTTLTRSNWSGTAPSISLK